MYWICISKTMQKNVGLFFLFFYIMADAISKCSEEYIQFMKPKYEDYYLTWKIRYYEKVYIYVVMEIVLCISGAFLILSNYYSYGSRILVCTIIPVTVITHALYQDKEFNLTGFLHLSRNFGIVGGLLILEPLNVYLYENNKLKLKIQKMEEIIGKQNMKIVNDEVSADLKNDIDEDAIRFNLRKRIRNGGF